MEAYLAGIVAGLFGVNMALVGWTFNKLDARVTAISARLAHLETGLAVLTALAQERKALLEEFRKFR